MGIMEQNQTDGQRVGLNAWQLKLIAIVAMVIDHLAFSFVPDGTFLAVAMHFIGRITGPEKESDKPETMPH